MALVKRILSVICLSLFILIDHTLMSLCLVMAILSIAIEYIVPGVVLMSVVIKSVVAPSKPAFISNLSSFNSFSALHSLFSYTSLASIDHYSVLQNFKRSSLILHQIKMHYHPLLPPLANKFGKHTYSNFYHWKDF